MYHKTNPPTFFSCDVVHIHTYIHLIIFKRDGRPAVKCETRSKGATRIVGMFDKGLLIATTGTGDMLLYGLPPSKDKTTLIWEEHINVGKLYIYIYIYI